MDIFNTEIYSPQHRSKYSHHFERESNVYARGGEVCTWLHSICEQHPENKTVNSPWDTLASGVCAPGCNRDSLSKGIIGHTSFC